jgi:hypothetical protein
VTTAGRKSQVVKDPPTPSFGEATEGQAEKKEKQKQEKEK